MRKEKAELLIVDDHSLVLEGLKKMIGQMPEVVITGICTSGTEASELILKNKYELYILDLQLDKLTGENLITQIRKQTPQARIIVCTQHEKIFIINRLMMLNINGIVLKSSDCSEMIEAIRAVLKGENYFCKRTLQIKEKNKKKEIIRDDFPTKRELQVLNGIARGLKSAEIAKEMEIAINTVETFRKRLLQKFNAKNSIDLVKKATIQGWVTITFD